MADEKSPTLEALEALRDKANQRTKAKAWRQLRSLLDELIWQEVAALKTTFTVWSPYDTATKLDVEADDHQDAAQAFLKKLGESEPSALKVHNHALLVQAPGEEPERWSVYIDWQPAFTALKEEGDDDNA